ncbi:MAG: hypothetical protein AB1609_09395 [Bacillota bacterium]
MFRLLQLADLHLGWAPGYMDEPRRAERRRRRDELLRRAVVTVPGNHDEITYADSVYRERARDWPGVLVQNPVPEHVSTLSVAGIPVHVYSLAYTGGLTPTRSALARFPRIGEPGFHLGAFHGTLGAGAASGACRSTRRPSDRLATTTWPWGTSTSIRSTTSAAPRRSTAGPWKEGDSTIPACAAGPSSRWTCPLPLRVGGRPCGCSPNRPRACSPSTRWCWTPAGSPARRACGWAASGGRGRPAKRSPPCAG